MKRLEVEEIVNTLNAFKNFTGGPTDRFSDVALATFYSLSICGLTPQSKFLDVGCGALRLGFLIMNYLDEQNYYGVEPNTVMLDEGKKKLASNLIDEKKPTFSHTEDFAFHDEFSREDFDFALARSIFTHASKDQIERCFMELSKVLKKDGVFLSTYVAPRKVIGSEYKGKEWLGRSHKSDTPGIAKYKKETLLSIAETHGFKEDTALAGRVLTANQEWLILRKT